MTQDEIRKIAEEFLKEKYPKSLRDFEPHIIKSMDTYLSTIFEWLSEKYFIVEKSKVMEEIDKIDLNINLFKAYPEVKAANNRIKNILKRIFGTDFKGE